MKQQIFSNNQKISTRQISRTILLEMLGISSLLLPGILASNSKTDGIFAMILGALGAAALLAVWNRMTQRKNFYQAMDACGRAVRLLVSLFYGVVFLLIGGFVLFLLTRVIQEHLLNVQFEAVILVSLTAAGIFGLLKGMECRVRIYEVLFWFLLIPLLVILGLAAASVNVDYWPPVFVSEPVGFLKSVYSSFLFFSLSSLFLLFQPYCRRPQRAVRGVWSGLLVTVLLNAAVYLILVGIFQKELLGNMSFPIITLMAVVKLPGEFFERQDAFMIAIWFFCLFSLLNSMLFYGKEMLQNGVRMFRRRNEEAKETGWANSVWACACGLGVLAEALVFLHTETTLERFLNLFSRWLFPLLLLLAFIIFGISKRKGRSR